MSFKDRSFNARFGKMGDEAEKKFEETYGAPFVRFGLDRPPISMKKLPARIRNTPDYLTSSELVECKGVGRDQKLKLKEEAWNCLNFWNGVMPLRIFIWDSHRKRHVLTPLDELRIIINDPSGGVTTDHFHDGKIYFEIPLSSLAGQWTSIEEPTTAMAA